MVRTIALVSEMVKTLIIGELVKTIGMVPYLLEEKFYSYILAVKGFLTAWNLGSGKVGFSNIFLKKYEGSSWRGEGNQSYTRNCK